MANAREKKWFGVKLVFRTNAVGKPQDPDKYYDQELSLVEERILIVLAKDSGEALAKAEEDAAEYASDYHYNPYSQKVVTRYLDIAYVFEMYELPEDGAEVFSATRLVSKDTRKSELADVFIGQKESKLLQKKRVNFLNDEYSGRRK